MMGASVWFPARSLFEFKASGMGAKGSLSGLAERPVPSSRDQWSGYLLGSVCDTKVNEFTGASRLSNAYNFYIADLPPQGLVHISSPTS
jgi:hypothetical protein